MIPMRTHLKCCVPHLGVRKDLHKVAEERRRISILDNQGQLLAGVRNELVDAIVDLVMSGSGLLLPIGLKSMRLASVSSRLQASVYYMTKPGRYGKARLTS